MSQERRYDIDWLRAIGMAAVFAYHIGMFFNPWTWHVKALEPVEGVKYFNLALVPWIMPLMFVISGLGTHYALSRRSNGEFLRERLVRLGPPLVMAVVLLSPYQVYVERLTYGQFAGSFAEWLPSYLEGWYGITPQGNFAWMGLHLWYVFFLLLFSVITLPIFRLRGPGLWRWVGANLGPAGILLVPAVLLFLLRLSLDPEGAGVAISGWPLLIYLAFYVLGSTLFPSPEFRETVRKLGPAAAGGAAFCTVIFMSSAEVGYGFGAPQVLRAAMWVGAGWLAIVGLFWAGDRFLNRNSPALRYAGEAVMPVYILHQPVIVLLGFWLRGADLPPAVAIPLLFAGAFVVTLGLHHFAVMRVGPLRVLFGVKAAPRLGKGVAHAG